MGLFGKAKDNYDRRKDIAEYNYRAREYVSDGQRIYEDAYVNLQIACSKTESKVNEYIRYKQGIFDEINKTLKKIDAENHEIRLLQKVEYIDFETCAVRQQEQLDCIDKALATWVIPSVSDLFSSVSLEDYYEAKQNMYRAKAYKETMRTKRDELKNARDAVRSIPDFIYDEKHQIEELMDKFRKTVAGMNNDNSEERTNCLCQIAQAIADLLTTQFINNNYQITAQYSQVHNRISAINNSLSGAQWLIEG